MSVLIVFHIELTDYQTNHINCGAKLQIFRITIKNTRKKLAKYIKKTEILMFFNYFSYNQIQIHQILTEKMMNLMNP